MFGVALSERALVAAPGYLEIAFERLVREIAASRALPLDARRVTDVAARLGGRLSSSPALIDSVIDDAASRALETPVTFSGLAARFRQLAAIAAREQTTACEGASRLLETLHELRAPTVVLSPGYATAARAALALLNFHGAIVAADDLGTSISDLRVFAAAASALAVPAERVWFLAGDLKSEARPAAIAGFNVVLVAHSDATAHDGITVVERADRFLDVLAEPYTRSALHLRHVMRSALEWRNGHYLGDGDLLF